MKNMFVYLFTKQPLINVHIDRWINNNLRNFLSRGLIFTARKSKVRTNCIYYKVTQCQYSIFKFVNAI